MNLVKIRFHDQYMLKTRTLEQSYSFLRLQPVLSYTFSDSQTFDKEEVGAGYHSGCRQVRLLWSCLHQCQASESFLRLSNSASATLCTFWSQHLDVICRPQGFCLDWCKKPDVGLPKPDLVMFLQLSAAEAALRGQFGEERYETSVFQRAVQQKFEQLMKDPSVNWQVWVGSVLWIYSQLTC